MNQLCFSLTFIFLVLFMNFHVNAAADVGLVSTACKKAVAESRSPKVNYGFCVSSLEADPKSNTYDVFQLGVESYKHVLQKEKSIKSYIKKLLKDGKQSQNVKVPLAGCSQDYSDIIEPTEYAIEVFRSGYFDAAYARLDVILYYVGSCKDRFDGKITSPLIKEENDFNQLLFISRVITEMAMAALPPP
ncbi:hypothetical protein MKW94_003692 [Papaver nudicaule]|uniref:Pectinesterase inhibitor domain-containing protein n=1 Tax=Papaver nudicaule TaxID=74823 RepID=A0AA42B5H1_PAPNU|nr:hypothetical protein [Papaver nudicaule]